MDIAVSSRDINVPLEPKSEVSLPFLNSGECSDEVVLRFDDEKKLYVSENFLCYASPVFKAMFQHDFKEKETKEVALKEKNYDDFLELLLCLHPGVQKTIDNSNVLRIVAFAEEYQIGVTVEKCLDVMGQWLSSEVESAFNIKKSVEKAKHAKACLTILTKSYDCGFDELVTYAISVIARFGYEVFTGTISKTTKLNAPQPAKGFPVTLMACQVPIQAPSFGSAQITNTNTLSSGFLQAAPPVIKSVCPVKECKTLFDNLQEEVKTRLCLQRLKLCDNGEMR